MKKIISILASALLLVACGDKTITINGDFSQFDMVAPDSKVELFISGSEEALASTNLDANKSFTADIKVGGEQFVMVVINDSPMMELITEGKDINFNFNAETQSIDYAEECLNERMRDIKNGISEKMEPLYTTEDEDEAEQLFADLVAHIDALVVENKDNILSLKVLQYYMYYGENEARFAELFEMINPKYSELAIYKEYKKHIENSKNTTIGADLVDITLPDANGTMVSVSELCKSGKWVLVDFWATWCGPCRGEIPHLVEAYAEFAPKGLEIYGISFDRNGDEAKWQKFIADNKMTWVNVWGIDSEGKWSAGEAYNVSSIPANFLFSPEGKLVAKNLRGDDVKKILAEHIK